MKTKYQKIKPKVGNDLLAKTDNGWKRVGKITEVEPNGIVHFTNMENNLNSFIWIFQEGTSSEHLNNLFKWGKLDRNLDWKEYLLIHHA
jgi:hypothetical protein